MEIKQPIGAINFTGETSEHYTKICFLLLETAYTAQTSEQIAELRGDVDFAVSNFFNAVFFNTVKDRNESAAKFKPLTATSPGELVKSIFENDVALYRLTKTYDAHREMVDRTPVCLSDKTYMDELEVLGRNLLIRIGQRFDELCAGYDLNGSYNLKSYRDGKYAIL